MLELSIFWYLKFRYLHTPVIGHFSDLQQLTTLFRRSTISFVEGSAAPCKSLVLNTFIIPLSCCFWGKGTQIVIEELFILFLLMNTEKLYMQYSQRQSCCITYLWWYQYQSRLEWIYDTFDMNEGTISIWFIVEKILWNVLLEC